MNLHKSQAFFYLVASFMLGVLFASVFSFSMFLGLVFVILGLSVVALGYNNKIIFLIGFLVIFFSFGILRFNLASNSKVELVEFIGQDSVFVGYIESEPETRGSLQRFVFKVGNDRILITSGAYPKYKFGEKIEVKGELKSPENFSEFNYVTYLKRDGIKLVMAFPKIESSQADLDLELNEKLKILLYKNIFLVKEKFETAINRSISEPNAAFINGVLLGTRQNIPDELKDAFSKTGTTHILAISGYNIMIISEAVLLGLVWFFRRRVAFWISLAIIILFVILTGASASVVRAAVMGILLSFANGYGRLYDQKNSIIFAGGLMILANPYALVFDIGFQLSFAAVLGLIYLYPWLERRLYKIPEGAGLKELILMTFSAQLAVAPLLLYYFGNFSLVSLPANILILPFVPLAMFFGFISGLAGMIFLPLGQITGYIAWAITTYQIEVVKYFFSGIV